MSDKKSEETSGRDSDLGLVYHWKGFKGDIHPETFPTLAHNEVIKADVGSDHYLFLTKEKLVFASGSNTRGQLGIGSSEEGPFPDPVLIESLSDKGIVDILCGFTHSAAISENGEVYCWGESSAGECGTGKDDTVISPERVEFPSSTGHKGEMSGDSTDSLVKICQVACGKNHTLALSSDGQIWAWGSGIQLGVKGVAIATRPILVDKLADRTVLAVYCGEKFSIAVVKRLGPSTEMPSAQKSKLRIKKTASSEDSSTTCEACSEEIFSFTETLDTVIITEAQKNLIESELSPEFSATRLTHTCKKGNLMSSNSDQSCGSISNSLPTKPDNNAENEPPITPPGNESSKRETTPEKKETTLSDSASPNSSNVTPKTTQSIAEDPSVKDKVDGTAFNDDEGNQKEPVPSEIENPPTAGLVTPLSQVKDPGNSESKNDEAIIPEEVSPVWKMRPEFVNIEENTSPDPPDVVQSRSEGSTNENANGSNVESVSTSKVVRAPSTLVNESEARDYLAKQFAEEEKTPKKKSSMKCPPDSPSLSAFESVFSSTVATGFNQVSNITSKAFSNIRSLVSGSATDIDSLDKAISQDLSNSSQADGKIGVMESSFSASDDSNSTPMTKSVTSLNLSPESPRKSPPVSHDRESPDQSQSRKSLLGSTGKLQSVPERNTSTAANKESIETEIWSWGKNNKGQLGHGDMGDRESPCCVKMLSSKNIVKLATGGFHTLALTASSQVYSWGANSSGQLGHTEDGPSPTKVKLLSSYPVWDIACGQSHSLFLVDSTGFMPDVCYCGKQPSEGVYAPVVKTSKPVGLTFLKKAQTGWIRRVIAKGDNCMCLVDKDNQGGKATQFEFVSSERTFNMLLLRIATQVTRPLHKSEFFLTLDVNPYRVTLLKMLDAFISLTRKIGRSCVEMTSIIRDGGSIMAAEIISQCEEFVIEFHKYSRAFCDFLAIGGFEYCAKNGSQFFDKLMGVFQDFLDFVSKNNHAQNLSQVMMLPFERLKEYCRLTNKMTLNFDDESPEEKHLVKCCSLWEKLRSSITTEYNTAETTRAFWDTLSNRLADYVRVPKRRLIKSSKTCPLSLFSAGRFSAHLFFLFDDTFVHVQGNTYQSFPLSVIWVETPSETEQLRNVIVVTTPEDTLTLCAPTPENKAEWLMALNQAINKVLANQKTGRRTSSSDRLTPPLIRFASHTFTKLAFKDAFYRGYWINGFMNGQGELEWPDGRKYSGKFKLGLQHGHGVYVHLKSDGEELYDGKWKDGKMHGFGKIKYTNGDVYEGYMKDGLRSGHGTLKQGRHTSSAACVYIGAWFNDRCQGYGVMDDVLKGEKYMGVWNEDMRHGAGIVVTLDGMYFEGTFYQNRMLGIGIMLTDDNSCYEGEFNGITQLSGKGTLTMPNGDRIEGQFSGSWNEGLKVNGTFHKNPQVTVSERKSYTHELGIMSSNYGRFCVQAHEKWEDIFTHCRSLLGYNGLGKPATAKAWEVVAVMVSSGKRSLKEGDKQKKSCYRLTSLEELEKIPPHSIGKLTTEYYLQITVYLLKAFDTPFHPLGKLIEALVDVFRAAYIGVGAHPRLLHHAVEELKSYVKRIYGIVRILFPDLPRYGGPKQIFSESDPGVLLTTEAAPEMLKSVTADDIKEESGEVITPAGLLHPILLPKVYPPLFDLYALFNDKEDEKYWERVQRLNRQGDMALMAYLGIEQKFWLIDEKMFQEKREKLSTMKDECYSEAVDTLQRLSTAFSPADKLAVIEQTFVAISQAVQTTSNDGLVWCMDDLFPIFQFVVVRSKIRHLGAEIHMIEDLMESHLEFGEYGVMFTTLKACYFQIQTEKLPMH